MGGFCTWPASVSGQVDELQMSNLYRTRIQHDDETGLESEESENCSLRTGGAVAVVVARAMALEAAEAGFRAGLD